MIARGSQFYLPPTHKPYLPLLPSRRASLPFGWYSLRLHMDGWPGWVYLAGWLYTEIGFLHQELNPGSVSHPSTNLARRRVTLLIVTNALAVLLFCDVWRVASFIHSIPWQQIDAYFAAKSWRERDKNVCTCAVSALILLWPVVIVIFVMLLLHIGWMSIKMKGKCML